MGATSSEQISGLLGEIDDATRALRAATEVPTDVATFVEGLAEELHAARPDDLLIDPYMARSLYAGALLALKALRHDEVTQQRRQLRLALEQLRHAVRDVTETAAVADDRSPRDVLRHLVAILDVPQTQVAHLLSISPRQLQRWLSPYGPTPGGVDAARLRVVAQVADQLRHTFTGPGVVRWFDRAHPRLGKPPRELLDDPLQTPRLRELALSARSQSS